LQTQAIGVFEERLHGHRGRAVDTGFGDFRGKPNDPNHPLGGIVEISAGEGPVAEASFYARVMRLFGFDGARPSTPDRAVSSAATPPVMRM